MLIHDVNPRWIIKPISRAAWRTSWHGNGLFTGSRFTAFNLPAPSLSLSRPPRERERTVSIRASRIRIPSSKRNTEIRARYSGWLLLLERNSPSNPSPPVLRRITLTLSKIWLVVLESRFERELSIPETFSIFHSFLQGGGDWDAYILKYLEINFHSSLKIFILEIN